MAIFKDKGNSLGKQMRELICEQYGSIPKLAKRLGISEQTIYSALNNGLLGSSFVTIMPILDALNIDPYEFARGQIVFVGKSEKKYPSVPLYDPQSPKATAIGQFPIPNTIRETYPNAFLLRISSESMNQLLPKDCYALVDPCNKVDAPGQPYAIAIGKSGVTVQRAFPLENGLRLEPCSDDPTIRQQVFDFGEPTCENVDIIGRVVWYTLPFDWLAKR